MIDVPMEIRLKRAYDQPARGDGWRVLVERLWPRGMKKEALAADAWLKKVAPSTELRKWFDHRVDRWDEFRRRYRDELTKNPDGWAPILEAGRRGTVTLLYSAHDTLHNGALVLRDYLENRMKRGEARPSASRRGPAPARAATKQVRRRATTARRAARTTS
jgi:uncharacterized protein YeaO (DUF488 family)